MRYDIYAEGAVALANATLAQAAKLAELDKADIESAIEEHGRCDTDTHTIVEHGGPAPEPLEEKDERSGSVVRSGYKEKYRLAGNARGCGDWLHLELAIRTLDDKKKLILSALLAICAANGVKTDHYNTTNNGWQGRLRMSTGMALRNIAKKQGFILDADGTKIEPQPMAIAA